MNIKATKHFIDSELQRYVAKDEVINVSKEHGDRLVALDYGVEDIKIKVPKNDDKKDKKSEIEE